MRNISQNLSAIKEKSLVEMARMFLCLEYVYAFHYIGIIMGFKKMANISDEDKAAILDELKHKRLMSMLVNALFKSDSFQANLNLSSYRYTGIEVEIAALPAVRLKYQKILPQQNDAKEIVTTSLEEK